jgi:hypothetical protein
VPEVWILLVYVAVILLGARLMEALARVHFERGRRYAEQGFTYDSVSDQYQCPAGESLSLRSVDTANRLAVYRAPVRACGSCALKGHCVPHADARTIFRPLAAWAETDVAWFHRRLSILMFGAGMLLCAIRLGRFGGEPGTGCVLVASLACAASLWRELRGLKVLRPSGDALPNHPR